MATNLVASNVVMLPRSPVTAQTQPNKMAAEMAMVTSLKTFLEVGPCHEAIGMGNSVFRTIMFIILCSLRRQVIMNKLWFGRDLGPAVTEPRIHSELVPSANVTIEKDKKYRLSDDIQDGLRARGHDISESPYFAVVQGIYKADKKKIYAMSDPRKYGKPAGF